MALYHNKVPTERTRVRRLPQRGAYDRPTIDAILDEATVCHLGFVHDGHPVVIPTLHARVGDRVLVHGSSASRMLRAVGAGVPACLTVTLVDGLVLARSAFHHSVNYRSVVVLGRAVAVEGAGEKRRALEAFTEQLVPGRWADVRPPTDQELRATVVLALPLDEASAKIRTGPPVDEEDDLELDVWAGIVPLSVAAHPPVGDEHLKTGIPPPAYATDYSGARTRATSP
jgi:nitroimidazol reductase NimA-like FMN-containing flavoprotein (pyridoxamine 5'-phosphate oxidase superfamily)